MRKNDVVEVKLKDAFELQMGKTPARSNMQYWDGNNKWISIADIGKANKFISETKEGITDLAVDECGIKIVPKGTVIMSFKLSIGKTAITSEDIYTNEAIMAFIDKGKYEIDTDYLYHYCSGTDWSAGSNKAVMGMTLNKATLSEKRIKIPNIAKQKSIAYELDDVDELISIKKQQNDELGQLIKSRFVEMFGDTVINPMSWEEHRLDEYIEFLTSGSRGWSQYFVDTENELFITIKNVKNNHITLDNIQYVNAPDNKEAERTKVRAGDLLISITADLGRTGVVDEKIAGMGAYINQHLSLVRLDGSRVNPLYVSHFLETEGGKIQFESKNQNGVKAGLNFDAIKSLKILVPPMELQNKYIEFVKQVEKAKQVIKEQLAEMETLKKSLIQKYFG